MVLTGRSEGERERAWTTVRGNIFTNRGSRGAGHDYFLFGIGRDGDADFFCG
jgi:hypothetical protein